MRLPSDPPNFLAPSTGQMLATLAVLLLIVAAAVYVVRRVWRALAYRQPIALPATGGPELQAQVEALASQVHELDQAQQFVEQLVARRSSGVSPDLGKAPPGDT